jgi:hypothetical protein
MWQSAPRDLSRYRRHIHIMAVYYSRYSRFVTVIEVAACLVLAPDDVAISELAGPIDLRTHD